MKKRIVFFVLAASLLVLSACGGSPSGGTDPVALGKDLTEQAEALPDMTVISSETADGEELSFSIPDDADKTEVNGMTIGDTLEVTYIGTVDGADTAGATVVKLVQISAE